ncbi:uncharacterized protein ACLA_041430 [Aspergillus clavatus NRRL 1]|uniref:Uncharacterized protein n=1 Tax=Aspergillus clavatus (strain ATCC 1007 / CBS 513.65 / DSM 816 / NCTC 3887 / NRRL 1 / QM 1276 / 107) TaxID=344612 RepID=A1CLA1_ASPCL|nr:uncharacterized protein ACLA_041430 [Aspergillus clavatus NRRL 1]EAW09925.1 conserved hypothetical protein [Aspergillus clavatus NRRL 1]
MDAGGLAQMTYNSSFGNGNGLGVPGSGFASRRKGSHVKRLSVPPPHISTIDESQPSAPIPPTPRTSRSHLLAGLRTAPKSATLPSAAHRQQHLGLETGRYGAHSGGAAERVPQTATGAAFPRHSFATNQNMDMGTGRPMYTLPEQVLAPPALDIAGDMPIDDNLYAELMSTNLFLAAQQQRLQQQLISVTAAAQQFQGLNLGNSSMGHMPEIPSLSVPAMGFYQQQLQQGVQPVVQPVPGQPGLFSVYNPLTSQQNYIYDNTYMQDNAYSPYREEEDQYPVMQAPTFRAEVSPPPESAPSPLNRPQTRSPPNASPSPPREVAPLPPPSANAFRRGHKKSSSVSPVARTTIDTARANNVSITAAGPKSAVFPPTPATGTFGPGQGRAGEHPVRQPRGPPSLEELVAKPTSKHEGSKNFATRQRRRALHSLVRAGIERRGETRSFGYNSSGGTNTPASEKDFAFSDGDDATVRSGSLSSKPSLGSLRAVANGAIGSERKERSSRERKSQDSPYNTTTPISEDGNFFGGKFADLRTEQAPPPSGPPSVAAVVAGQKTVAPGPERRKTPMLVLSSAEKRKTPFM